MRIDKSKFKILDVFYLPDMKDNMRAYYVLLTMDGRPKTAYTCMIPDIMPNPEWIIKEENKDDRI